MVVGAGIITRSSGAVSWWPLLGERRDPLNDLNGVGCRTAAWQYGHFICLFAPTGILGPGQFTKAPLTSISKTGDNFKAVKLGNALNNLGQSNELVS